MRLSEVFGKTDVFGGSMLSGTNEYPYDIDTEQTSDGIVFTAVDPESGDTMAKWEIKNAIITSRQTSEEKFAKVFDAMMRYICKYADAQNIHLMVDQRTFEPKKKGSLGRKFQSFGFIKNSNIGKPSLETFMERRPGAGLALVSST